jgi:hypothetical protein
MDRTPHPRADRARAVNSRVTPSPVLMAPLIFSIPGRLLNPLNVGAWGLYKHRRWARTRREQAAEAARVAMLLKREWRDIDPAAPKRIAFLAIVPKRFDDDGLRSALKPTRDGLADARLIHHDGPKSGHEFTYDQTGTRAEPPRVLVTITAAGKPNGPDAESHHSREGDDERDAR